MGTNEPIRWAVYIAALVGAAAGFMIDLDAGLSLLRAGGEALATLVPVLLGAEYARAKAYGPVSVSRVLDADGVIAAVERQHGT